MPTPPISLDRQPLAFYGGLAGALLPFAVFLAGVATLAFMGAPDERGFWPVLLAALCTGLLLAKDRSRYADAMLDGMSQRLVMVMLCAWLFAGVLGSLLTASGFVAGLAWAAQAAHFGPALYVGAAFLACAIVATSTGTSFGTILLCGPLLYPAGAAVHANPPALLGAILAGATWGDSMSPLSDTTIASSGTQGADVGGTVRSRLRYSVPAGLLALVASMVLGARGADGVVADATVLDGRPLALVMIAVPALSTAMLLRRRHLVEALLVGIMAAVVLGLVLGLLTPSQLLHVDAERFGATGIIVTGMERAVGVCVFTLLLVALVGTLQATQALERLVAAAAHRARTPRAAESWIVGVVSVAVILTTHSVVAILAVGEFAKRTGEGQQLSAYRRANLLDLTVCTWPFVLPFFLPTILAANASRHAAGTGMPILTPGEVGLHNTYALALVIVLALAVTTGYGRTGRTT